MIARITVAMAAGPMSMMLALPKSEGPYPAVLVCHHRDGLDPFTEQVVERLAQNGFAAAAPNFYHRRPADEPGRVSRQHLTDGEVVDDINAAVRCLQTMSSVRSTAVAILGHCMGGRIAYLGAAAHTIFRAAVVLYGGNIFRAEGAGRPAPGALTAQIGCPVLGLFGKADGNPAPADVARLADELDRHGIRHEFHSYDDAGHAFQNFLNPDAYRPAAAEDAWTRLLDFLRRSLAV